VDLLSPGLFGSDEHELLNNSYLQSNPDNHHLPFIKNDPDLTQVTPNLPLLVISSLKGESINLPKMEPIDSLKREPPDRRFQFLDRLKSRPIIEGCYQDPQFKQYYYQILLKHLGCEWYLQQCK
jgi:hypothetical protein